MNWYKISRKHKNDKQPLTTEEREEVKKRFGDTECSFFKDDQGYYCTTHRARCKSYPSIAKIPQNKVDFISSTS